MNQLFAGATLMVLGIGLMIFNIRMAKKNKESTAFEMPYLRNAGIGFILFGLYNLSKYFFAMLN